MLVDFLTGLMVTLVVVVLLICFKFAQRKIFLRRNGNSFKTFEIMYLSQGSLGNIHRSRFLLQPRLKPLSLFLILTLYLPYNPPPFPNSLRKGNPFTLFSQKSIIFPTLSTNQYLFRLIVLFHPLTYTLV